MLNFHRMQNFIFPRFLSTGGGVLTNKLKTDSDLPVNIPDPYKRERKLCFICKHDIPLDYKFVSPYTGRIYGRHITGLCMPMQKRISRLITRSRQFGYMPLECKEEVFLSDRNIVKSWNDA